MSPGIAGNVYTVELQIGHFPKHQQLLRTSRGRRSGNRKGAVGTLMFWTASLVSSWTFEPDTPGGFVPRRLSRVFSN